MTADRPGSGVIRQTSEQQLVRSYTWGDSASVFTGPVTGTQPVIKNWSYYKRSWLCGSPFGTMALWDDLDHVPTDRQFPNVRPDLALDAMKGILKQVEVEIEEHEQLKKVRRARREEHLRKFRERHLELHEKMEALGAPLGGTYHQILRTSIMDDDSHPAGRKPCHSTTSSSIKNGKRSKAPSEWKPPQRLLQQVGGSVPGAMARNSGSSGPRGAPEEMINDFGEGGGARPRPLPAVVRAGGGGGPTSIRWQRQERPSFGRR